MSPDKFNLLIYYIAKILGDIFMLSILKTLFLNIKEVPEKSRRALLFIVILMITLNAGGIYRNSFTLWKHQDFMSYFFLTCDILQLILCAVVLAVVYLRDELPNKSSIVIFLSSILFFVVNIYNFLINFHYFKYEGILVFIFWFINNGGMIAFSTLIVYLIITNRFKYEKG